MTSLPRPYPDGRDERQALVNAEESDKAKNSDGMQQNMESAVGPGSRQQGGSGVDSRGRRGGGASWLVWGAAAWAVALLVGVAVSVDRDAPTSREQRDIAQAAPVVDAAVGELVFAGQGRDVVLELSPRRLDTGCRLTASWDGAELERSLTIHTAAANDAAAVLERVAQRLPAGYQARIGRGKDGAVRRMRADAGNFVAVSGMITAPGEVVLTVTTGCRPPSPGFDPSADPHPQPAVAVAHGAERSLRVAGANPIEPGQLTMVPCPGGGEPASTERASARLPLGPAQRAALSKPADTIVLIDSTDRLGLSYPDGTLLLQADGDRLDAVYTRTCPG